MAQRVQSVNIVPFSGDAADYPGWRRRFEAHCAFLDLADVFDAGVQAPAQGHELQVYRLLVMSLQGASEHLVSRVEPGRARELLRVVQNEYAPATALYIKHLRSKLYAVQCKGSVKAYFREVNTLRDQLAATHAVGANNNEELMAHIATVLPATLKPIALQYVAHVDAAVRGDWAAFSQAVVTSAEFLGDGTVEAAVSPSDVLAATPAPAAASAAAGAAFDGGQRFRGECYHCGNYGHRKSECRKLQRELQRSRGGGNTRGGHARGTSSNAATGQANVAHILLAAATSTDPPPPGSSDPPHIVLDSGAAFHVVADKAFVRGNEVARVNLELANKEVVTVGRYDSAVITMDGRPFVLKDVILLPRGRNLLSVRQLNLNGHRVEFDDLTAETAVVRLADGSPLVARVNSHKVFAFPLQVEHPATASTAVATAAAKAVLSRDEAALWHRRLGHASASTMRAAGFNVADDVIVCHECMLSKSTRAPTSTAPATVPERPGGKIHTDLCGPLPASISGKRYVIAFTDGCSRFTYAYCIARKSDAPAAMTTFLSDAEADGIVFQHGDIVQCDNDSVYRSADFLGVLRTRGLRLRCSAPYQPSQNGTAERLWRSLFERARAMLFDSKLPNTFWPAAVHHAAFLHNVLPHRGLDGKSPHERLLGSTFDASVLRPFGCAAYVHKQDAQKLAPRARVGIYLGHSRINNCSIVHFPDTNTTVESRHLQFDESSRGPAPAPRGGEDSEPHQQRGASADPFARVLDTVAPDTRDDTPPAPHDNTDDGPTQVQVQDEEIDMLVNPDSAFWTQANTATTEPGPFDDDLVAFALLAASVAEGADPMTLAEALASLEADAWRVSIAEEMAALDENKTWQVVSPAELPPGARALSTKLVFKRKLDQFGNVERLKTRLVVRGFEQRAGRDFAEVFAPVVHKTTVRVALAIAAALGLSVHHLDVSTAFLNGTIDGDVFIKLPDGIGRDGQVCKLLKALYGLRQSPRRWNEVLDATIKTKLGMQRSKTDPCLYTRTDPKASPLFLVVWVDDILVIGRDAVDIDHVKSVFKSHFKIRDLGEASMYVGIAIRHEHGRMVLSQEHYTRSLMDKHNLADAKPKTTPLPPTWSLSAAQAAQPLDPQAAGEYRTIVGEVMYLATATRPDLSFAASQLAQVMSTPTHVAMHAAKHVLRYISGAPGLSLCYSKTRAHPGELTAWVDATWASDTATARSVTGYVVVLNGAAVVWKTKKQTSVARSSCEAEYSALGELAAELQFVRSLLHDMHLAPDTPVVVHEDNQGALRIATNAETSSRSKHFNVAYHYTRELIQNNTIKLQYCPTEKMIADGFTKQIPAPRAIQHRNSIFGT